MIDFRELPFPVCQEYQNMFSRNQRRKLYCPTTKSYLNIISQGTASKSWTLAHSDIGQFG